MACNFCLTGDISFEGDLFLVSALKVSFLRGSSILTAAFCDHLPCLDALLQTKDIDEKDTLSGETALCRYSVTHLVRYDVFCMMLNASVDVTAHTARDGSTLLMRVLSRECLYNTDLIHDLIARGVDITARNHEGDTALHYACRWCVDEAIVATITHAGAPLDQENSSGRTPVGEVQLTYAYARRTPDVSGPIVAALTTLLQAGARPDHFYPDHLHRVRTHNLPRCEEYISDLDAVFLHAHHALSAYACARVLIAGSRRITTRGIDHNISAASVVLSDYRLVAHISALSLSPPYTTLWRRKVPTTLAFEAIARLAITGAAGGTCDTRSTFWQTRRSVIMHLVKDADDSVIK